MISCKYHYTRISLMLLITNSSTINGSVSNNLFSNITSNCLSWWPCGLGMRLNSLESWDRGFDSRWGQEYSSVVLGVCLVGSGLCDELIAHSEEPYRVCLCLNVFGLCLGPSRAAAAQRKTNILVTNLFATNKSINSSTNSLIRISDNELLCNRR